MLDNYSEFMVKRKKTVKDILFRIGAVLLGIYLSMVLSNFLASRFLGAIALVMILGVWYGVYWVFAYTNIEYEYTVTNGEIDVDKIVARRRRKRIMSIKRKQIEMISYNYDKSKDQKVTDVTSGSKDKIICCVTFDRGKGTEKLLFEPSEKITEIFKQFMPGKVMM